MSSTSRQLLVGLDAMEWDLVRNWADQGKLPTFRRLIDHGTRAELKTTSAQLPDTVWASIYTGTNPGKFEKYFYVQYDPATGDLKNVPDDAIQASPFWDYLSQAGNRVGVVDAPKFQLSKSINGFHLTNWGAHATKTARASNPGSLLKDVQARFGKHPVGDCDEVDAKPEPLRNLRNRILDGVQVHGQLFRWLMREQQWDVFFAGFSAPHCIGHHFWHYHDINHPRHAGTESEGLGDSIEQVYRAIDREIAEMLEAAGPDTRVMIVAGHGMGPIYHASWNLPEILDLLGYGREPRHNAAAADREARVNPWRILKMVMPGKMQYGIKAMLPKPMQDELLFRWYAGNRDWKGRRAFAIPNNDSAGCIRINVKGRDKNGIVDSGQEYRQICEDIRKALYELTDPVSGKKVIRQVSWTQEEFKGGFVQQLPDLMILWETSFPWNAIHSPRFGTLNIRQQDGRSGSHSPHGFVLLAGEGIPANVELTGRSIYDIAPTVLEAAGVPIPEIVDGRPLPFKKVMAA